MITLSKVAAFSVGAALLLLVGAQFAWAEPTATELCRSTKQRGAGRYAACRLKADGKLTKSGRSSVYALRLARCRDRIGFSYDAAETLYEGQCPIVDDVNQTTGFLDTCAAAVTKASSGVESSLCRGRVAVANRGTNTVTLIEVDSEQKVQIELEEGSEPMYVHSPRFSNELWIGDREFDRVVIYDASRL